MNLSVSGKKRGKLKLCLSLCVFVCVVRVFVCVGMCFSACKCVRVYYESPDAWESGRNVILNEDTNRQQQRFCTFPSPLT